MICRDTGLIAEQRGELYRGEMEGMWWKRRRDRNEEAKQRDLRRDEIASYSSPVQSSPTSH